MFSLSFACFEVNLTGMSELASLSFACFEVNTHIGSLVSTTLSFACFEVTCCSCHTIGSYAPLLVLLVLKMYLLAATSQ